MASPPNPLSILTTTVGSYPIPDWLQALPSEQALLDATRVVFEIQHHAGIDLVTDGELSRFDINHPDTNGMIDYFVRPLGGVRSKVGRVDGFRFLEKAAMSWRSRPAGVVTGPLEEGSLNLFTDCARAASVAPGPFKFTVTSPYMLARTLLDDHYHDFEKLTLRLAEILAAQVADLPASCVQIDEANITGNPADGPLAARAINLILDQISVEKAVHFCFGNYGGQTIQRGTWKELISFLNSLHANHLVLEMAHRPVDDLSILKEIDSKLALGIGVIDVKINQVETADEVARRIDQAQKAAGPGRIQWVHPDCGFWMLKRSVADRKMEALVRGRDKFLGR